MEFEFYYSGTLGGFIPKKWRDDGTYPVWPDDAVEATQEEVDTYMMGQAPDGMIRGTSPEGRPIWVDIPPIIIPLPEMQESKRKEMRDACSDAITRSSFQSDALGAVHNYDCRIVDQLNLKVRYDISSAQNLPEPVWASDGTRFQWKNHTAAEIMAVMVDMNEHIKQAQVKLALKLAAVDAAEDKQDIEAIVW